jgi:hypothetical protein
MAPGGVRVAAHHDHVSMRRQRRRSMPAGGVWRQCAFAAGIETVGPRVVRYRRRAGRRLCVRRRPRTAWRPRRKAVPGESGRQYAPPSWRQKSLSAASSMSLRRGRKLRDATPGRLRRRPQNPASRRWARTPDATFRRQCRAAGDGCSAAGAWRVAGRVTPPGQIAFCTGSIRQVSRNRVRRHAPPDRDDPGRRHDRSAVLPRGLGYLRLLLFLAPAGQLGCGRTPAAVEDPGWRPATLTDWLMAVR